MSCSNPFSGLYNARLQSRRRFLRFTTGALLSLPVVDPLLRLSAATGETLIRPCGPGATCRPRIRAAFVRRKGEYGMRWPGAVYDGVAALKDYTKELRGAERDLGLEVTLRPEPIHSPEEADAWLAEAEAAKPDGLLVMLLDRQEHAWPTATKAIESGTPTIIFAPVGAAFTTNTWSLARKPGGYICSTSDFRQARNGLKMIKASSRLREMRYIVLRGTERKDSRVEHFGTRLRYVPARTFLEEYTRTPLNREIEAIAAAYIGRATGVNGPTEQDLYNGVKSYVVARKILEREEGDGITMDCLGALGHTKVSLPCIAWSRMLDQGLPAACEADISAAVSHALVQYLFDRPGFQQDPVPETARECLIGAHCTCPTRLNGFTEPAVPYDITHHHGKRDAVPRPVWREGQRVTVVDLMLGGRPENTPPNPDGKPQMLISGPYRSQQDGIRQRDGERRRSARRRLRGLGDGETRSRNRSAELSRFPPNLLLRRFQEGAEELLSTRGHRSDHGLAGVAASRMVGWTRLTR